MTNDYAGNIRTYLKKAISDLRPGDVVLHPVYRSDGLLLVGPNRVLSTSLIDKLLMHSLSNRYILVCQSLEKFHQFVKNDVASSAEFRADLQKLAKDYSKATNNMMPVNAFAAIRSVPAAQSGSGRSENPVSDLLSGYPYWTRLEDRLSSEHSKKMAEAVKRRFIENITHDKAISDLLLRIKDYDEVLFIHSLNSTCISLLMGITLELSQDELIDLILAAMFMNVGYIDVPNSQFHDYLRTHDSNHPAAIKHLQAFAHLLHSEQLRKEPIITAIADHHEFYNGKGVPGRKAGEEISLFGRILHFAHKYDSLVGGYKYTNGMLPFDAIRFIFNNRGTQFDPDLINVFLYRTTYFQIGEALNLPIQKRGVIIGFRNYVRYPYLPIVRLEDGSTIDLTRDL